MARAGRREAREEEMRAVLGRWERSGMTLSRFADREGIARKTLYRWRRRTGVGSNRVRRQGGHHQGSESVETTTAALFTEVTSSLGPVAATTVTFEVVLGPGTTVRVPEHFDPDSLRILVATLRGC